jgi:hypothetical protein
MPSDRLSGPDLSQYDAEANFVVRTGQSKKLMYARALRLFGGVVLFAGWVTAQRPWGVALILVGTCVGLTGFVWHLARQWSRDEVAQGDGGRR